MLLVARKTVIPTNYKVFTLCMVACVAGGIVRVRGKILTVEGEYWWRSREENGKEPLASRGKAARIGGSAAIASRWPSTRDNIPPATQAICMAPARLKGLTVVRNSKAVGGKVSRIDLPTERQLLSTAAELHKDVMHIFGRIGE